MELTLDINGEAHPDLAQPWWKWVDPVPAWCYLATDRGDPIGVVRAFQHVKLSCADAIDIDCIGIGGVYVVEAHRGARVADSLLTFAVRDNWRHPLVLRSKIDRTLYTRHGFVLLSEYADGSGIFYLPNGNSERPGPACRRSSLWHLDARF